MGNRTGGAGAGGGGAAGAELERTIPFSELEKKMKIAPKSREQIRDAWAVMDDEARRYVLNSGINELVTQRFRKGAKTAQQGGAIFRGEQLRIGRSRFPQNMEPTGEVRIRPIAGGMTPVKTASTLVHEAGHVGGKYTGPYKNLAKRGDPTENTSTNVQMRFLGRVYQEAIRTGNTGRGMEVLFSANSAFNYRRESSMSRNYRFKGGIISQTDRLTMFGDGPASILVGLSRAQLKRGAEQAAKDLGI